MKNNSKIISANEINKYLYCPYQWYYERFYGIKELRRLSKEKNEKLGLKDATKSNFLKGQAFHEEFLGKQRRLGRLAFYVLIAVLGAICGVVFWALRV